MDKRPTVTDVARAAGVSRQTVSNVFNAPEVVRGSTRVRVLQAVRALGYRPNESARRLRTTRFRSIGVRLGPDTRGIATSFIGPFLTALLKEGQRRQIRILPFAAEGSDDEIAAYARLIASDEVDGFVLTSTHAADPRVDWLQERDIPFVSFGRTSARGAAWVDVDGTEGARLATRSLLASGAERVAFISTADDTHTMKDRRAGWRDAMHATSLSADELDQLDLRTELDQLDLRTELDHPSPPHGDQLIRSVLLEADAVVCTSDTLATTVRHALGPATPVTGYDDSPIARLLGFDSISQPLDHVAAALVTALQHEGPTPTRVLAPTLATHSAA